jgi:transcription elongation factor GreA
MPDQIIISQEGYNKLKEELDMLTTTRRREIADRIEKAKELGDLSENAEYTEAKDAQALNEGRVAELTATLKNVVIVNTEAKASGEVSMGSTVKVKVNGSETREYHIVSFNEANPAEGKISNESPIGLALVGRYKGDEMIVKTPKGEMKFKILEIK